MEENLIPVRLPVWEQLLKDCRRIIDEARKDLGHDLGGGSLVDLLADNTGESLDVIKLVLKDLGETDG